MVEGKKIFKTISFYRKKNLPFVIRHLSELYNIGCNFSRGVIEMSSTHLFFLDILTSLNHNCTYQIVNPSILSFEGEIRKKVV